jgi:hypothetical protein
VVGSVPAGGFATPVLYTAGDIAVYGPSGWLPGFTPQAGARFYDKTTKELLGYDATYGFFPGQDRWSTTEHWTGRFQGGTGSTNRVLSKLIHVASINSSTKTVAHGITNLDRANPITVECWLGKSSDGFPAPQPIPTVDITIDGTNVTLNNSGGLSAYSADVRLCYRTT